MTQPFILWSASRTAGHEVHGQSVVYDEITGEDIALVYGGDKHADFIALACTQHAGLIGALHLCLETLEALHVQPDEGALRDHALKVATATLKETQA